MINILLTCAGRRHYLVEYFRNTLGGKGRVVGADMDPTAPALAACDAWHRVPSVFAPEYLEQLAEVIQSENINMVFSLNDLELEVLANAREELESDTGATIYVPPPDTLRICNDKWLTFQFVQQLKLATPATYLNVRDAAIAIDEGMVRFPLVVKPRWGSASIGLFHVRRADELVPAFEACLKAIAASPLAALGTNDTVLIQEEILGPEYGVDLLYGKAQNFIGFAAKRKLAMRAGETDKAVSVPPDAFVSMIECIATALPSRGNLDCDFLERDGQLHVLEFNPRFGGGYPFTHRAGANHIEMLLRDYIDITATTYSYFPGMAFAKCDQLIEIPAPPEHTETPCA